MEDIVHRVVQTGEELEWRNLSDRGSEENNYEEEKTMKIV